MDLYTKPGVSEKLNSQRNQVRKVYTFILWKIPLGGRDHLREFLNVLINALPRIRH